MSKRQDNLTLTERYTPHPKELQHYGTVAHVSIALDASVRGISAENLNQLLVDTMTLRALYKKHHWQVSGPTFISFTCSSTSTSTNRLSWSTPSRNESKRWAA